MTRDELLDYADKHPGWLSYRDPYGHVRFRRAPQGDPRNPPPL